MVAAPSDYGSFVKDMDFVKLIHVESIPVALLKSQKPYF